MRWRVTVVIGVVFTLLLAAGAVFWWLYLQFGPLTEYAPDYSHRAFNRVQEGMTVNEVRALVGEPLKKYKQPIAEWWTYRAPALPAFVSFDWDGKVYRVAPMERDDPQELRNKVKTGMSKEQVVEIFGDSDGVTPQEIAEWWAYALPSPRGCGSYYRRSVGIDSSGRVARIVSETWWD